MGKIFCVEFQRCPLKPHKISYPCIERCVFHSQMKIQELFDLRVVFLKHLPWQKCASIWRLYFNMSVIFNQLMVLSLRSSEQTTIMWWQLMPWLHVISILIPPHTKWLGSSHVAVIFLISYWGLNKMATILQMPFSNAFSSMKITECCSQGSNWRWVSIGSSDHYLKLCWPNFMNHMASFYWIIEVECKCVNLKLIT